MDKKTYNWLKNGFLIAEITMPNYWTNFELIQILPRKWVKNISFPWLGQKCKVLTRFEIEQESKVLALSWGHAEV